MYRWLIYFLLKDETKPRKYGSVLLPDEKNMLYVRDTKSYVRDSVNKSYERDTKSYVRDNVNESYVRDTKSYVRDT